MNISLRNTVCLLAGPMVALKGVVMAVQGATGSVWAATILGGVAGFSVFVYFAWLAIGDLRR